MARHGGSSAGLYLADPTSLIPSHCASIVALAPRVKHIVTRNLSIIWTWFYHIIHTMSCSWYITNIRCFHAVSLWLSDRFVLRITHVQWQETGRAAFFYALYAIFFYEEWLLKVCHQKCLGYISYCHAFWLMHLYSNIHPRKLTVIYIFRCTYLHFQLFLKLVFSAIGAVTPEVVHLCIQKKGQYERRGCIYFYKIVDQL